MLLANTRAASQPPRVILESLGDKSRVILADHITPYDDPEQGNGFVYDEVVFFMPEDRHDTLAEIEANFADWWAYGEVDPEPISLEQRVSDLEILILEVMEG